VRKSTLIVALITVAGLTTISVIGQEEALPAVTPRQIVLAEPTVFLAAEPIRELHAPSLVDAARRNDYASFDALYREAKRRGEQVGQFDTLHELWTWSYNDPIGAFYGSDMHARFAHAYPGYTAYIEDYRIVDSHGNTFYPTSETRTFLLDRIVEGNAPRVLIAGQSPSEEAPAPVVRPAHTPATHARTATRRHAASSAPKPAATTAVRTTRTAPAKVETPVTKAPAASAPEPDAIASAPVASSASPNTTASVPAPAPAPVTPVPVAATPAPAPVFKDVAQEAKPEESGAASRGLLLLVIGIIGIGLLAVMLRTPRESGPVSILTPQQPEKPAPVEPLRKAPVEPQEGEKKTRATGSHG